MVPSRYSVFGPGAAILFVELALAAALSKDDVQLLQDPGGWEYISVSDQDAGIQTEHVCFDGQPHPAQCTGRLTLSTDNTFMLQESIQGQDYDRRGTYEIEDNQVSFFDEFGTKDGPYTAQLNRDTKMLVLSMPQVRMELELESQYQDDLEKKKAPKK